MRRKTTKTNHSESNPSLGAFFFRPLRRLKGNLLARVPARCRDAGFLRRSIMSAATVFGVLALACWYNALFLRRKAR